MTNFLGLLSAHLARKGTAGLQTAEGLDFEDGFDEIVVQGTVH